MEQAEEHFLVQFEDVVPRDRWNSTQREVFDEHISYLKELEADGRLRYAGLAKNGEALAFGFALYEAEGAEEADRLMKGDPGVAKGLLAARFVRLQRFFGRAP